MAKLRPNRKCVRLSGIILLSVISLLFFFTLLLWPLASLSPSSDDSPDEKQSWGLYYKNPECNDTNWSAGSAFSTLLTVTSTYILQPRGSHAFPEAGRIWRLSPFFTLFETVWMVTWIIEGWLINRSF